MAGRGGILSGMDTELSLTHERIDDIPLIVGMAVISAKSEYETGGRPRPCLLSS